MQPNGDGTPVTAIPNSGYRFAGWSDGSQDNPRTDVDVTASADVTANFSLIPIPVVTTPQPSGSISGGQAYVCMDPKATNYDTYSSAGNTGCAYTKTPSQVIPASSATSMLFTKNLKAFQKSVGLASDGSFGPKTRAYVNANQ